MQEMQLTANARRINPAALSAPATLGSPDAPKPAAVVRHVSAGFGHKHATAFLLDASLPDGTHLVPASDERLTRPAPRKFTDAELLAIYHGMDSQAILANKEPGSFGDAILAAYGRAVLKAAGVQA